MVLAEVISDMNSNYENRKHGGNSMVFSIQEKIFSAFPQVGIENIFVSENYLPIGQRFERGTLEALKEAVNEFEMQNVLERSGKSKN